MQPSFCHDSGVLFLAILCPNIMKRPKVMTNLKQKGEWWIIRLNADCWNAARSCQYDVLRLHVPHEQDHQLLGEESVPCHSSWMTPGQCSWLYPPAYLTLPDLCTPLRSRQVQPAQSQSPYGYSLRQCLAEATLLYDPVCHLVFVSQISNIVAQLHTSYMKETFTDFWWKTKFNWS